MSKKETSVTILLMTWDIKLKKFIEYSFYAVFFIVPLIFLPGHVELFQFNKMITVYLLTTMITSAWVIRIVLSGQLKIKRTPFDIPLILFLISQVVSTIFSIVPYTSLWGYYSRFHGGLLSTASYVLLYYAFVSNVFDENTNRKSVFHNKFLQRSLGVLIVSVVTVALYGILEHYGIDEHYWVQDVRNRIFSTIGQPNWLAALLVTISPISMFYYTSYWLKQNGKRKQLNKIEIANGVVTLIFFTALLFTKSRSGLIGYAVMFLTFWFLLITQHFSSSTADKKDKESLMRWIKNTPIIKPAITSIIALTTLSLVIGTPFSPSLSQLPTRLQIIQTATQSAKPEPAEPQRLIGGSPSEDIRKIVWRGAIDVWKHWPLFGSGVETFAYSYYNFRPVEHNLVSEWDFLYNKAHNEYLNFLATTGVIGLGSYLLLQGTFVIWSLRNIYKKAELQLAAFISGYLGLSVVNFGGFSTVTVGMLLFLYPAFAYLSQQSDKQWISFKLYKTNSNNKLTKLQYIFLLITLLATTSMITEVGVRWYADRVFTAGSEKSRSGEITEGLLLQQKAAALVPEEPLFHDRLSLDLARSAAALYMEGATESAQILADTAELHSDYVMSINPYHINYLKNRTAVMIHLSSIDESYLQKAFNTLLLAKEHSPTDPKLTFNLSLLYLQKGEAEKAKQELVKTIELKPDYAAARLELAAMLEIDGKIDEARSHYEYILKYIDPNQQGALKGLERTEITSE